MPRSVPRVAERRVVDLVARRRAAFAPSAAGDPHPDGPGHTGGRDVVGGEPGVPGIAEIDSDTSHSGALENDRMRSVMLAPARWSSSYQPGP